MGVIGSVESSNCQAAVDQATNAVPATGERRPGRPFWREPLAPYARADFRRAMVDLATSVVPYVALSVLMYVALSVSYLLVLVIAVPAAGFLLRTYMVFHDCAHGSFLPSRRANVWLGTALGLVVFSPFQSWRHNHAVHHATAGDLERRGVGDVFTLTVAEYHARPWPRRLAYRLFRNPLVMFGLGPIWAMFIQPRLVSRSMRPRIRRGIIATNIALVVLVGALCALVGWREYLLVQAPTALLAGAAGVFLFYVQHQFEGTYWSRAADWSFVDAALQGSSYLKLPRPLAWAVGNTNYHHVHHLSARIPNYRLRAAHEEQPMFARTPVVTVRGSIGAFRLKLWDEGRGRLVRYREGVSVSPRTGSRTACPAPPLPSSR
jgi:omega-6 fatty acid desaturase (delta-12 desaturase)